MYGYALDNPATGTDPSGKGVIDCAKFLYYFNEYRKAVDECQDEYQKCDRLDSLDDPVCKQDFCSKHGAPADPPTAIARCACEKVGPAVCLDMVGPDGSGQKCGY